MTMALSVFLLALSIPASVLASNDIELTGDHVFSDGFEAGEPVPLQMVLELWWDTPGDPDQNDTGPAAGADLDLLLRHPDAVDWFDSTWSCYWLNTNPDWGVSNDGSDDPRLTRDDADGLGPESIEFTGLEEGVVYRVGAHYFNDNGFGPSTPNVKVYWKGELLLDYVGSTMDASDYFWDALRIERFQDGLSITAVNSVTPTPP